MIDYILLNQDKIEAIVVLIFFALLTRASVGIHHQNWIKTFSGTLTLVLLPIITFAITSVISGNIALSLGMIGALSIVRFRNPVRSSFELVIFFLMLSLGICAAADMRWLIILGMTSNILIITAYFVNIILGTYFNKKLFETSFSEGNSSIYWKLLLKLKMMIFSIVICWSLSEKIQMDMFIDSHQINHLISSKFHNIIKRILK